MKLNVTNETDRLEAVVLGIGVDPGEPIGINPLMRKHIAENTYPTEEAIVEEIKTFEKVLVENDIEIFRPHNLPGVEQIFTRDIGFVIEDKFCIGKMGHSVRAQELAGIQFLLDHIKPEKIVRFPEDAKIEGGDVLLLDDYILIGLSDRTNEVGVEYLKTIFPEKKILGLELVVDQDNADKNILHLDCAFQPIGKNEAIIYEEGFVNPPEIIYELFSDDQLIKVNMEQKNAMFPNVFSLDTDKVVIEKGFVALKEELLKRDYQVFEVSYSETSKLSGLLRCSTLPLRRRR